MSHHIPLCPIMCCYILSCAVICYHMLLCFVVHSFSPKPNTWFYLSESFSKPPCLYYESYPSIFYSSHFSFFPGLLCIFLLSLFYFSILVCFNFSNFPVSQYIYPEWRSLADSTKSQPTRGNSDGLNVQQERSISRERIK